MAHHKLIILRHGELEWNHLDKFCGWIDVSLTEKGRNEAQFAGRLIKQHKLEPMIMYTSKLRRSIQSGNIILQELQREWCDEIKTWRLNERHYGALQGRDKSEVYQQLGPEKYKYVRRDFNGMPPLAEDPSSMGIDERYDAIDIPKDQLPRAESLKTVMDRLIPFVEKEILQKRLLQENKTVLIVTHGSVCRSLIKYFNKVSDKDISSINVPTGIPIVFELDDLLDLCKDYYYLDHDLAMQRIAKVRDEGKPKS